MAALWNLGGEGREIVATDELQIIGKYDVRYRRSRGPKPNLKDPRYWEGKWEYFTEKYISLLQATPDSSLVLSELTLDPWEIPVPGPPSGSLSPIPSQVESLQPNSESIRVEEVQAAKGMLYDILSLEFFEKEGRKIVEEDDVYISGLYDISYRRGIGPKPNLQDPQYWRDKISYFYNHYLTSIPAAERNNPRRQIVPPSETTWVSPQSHRRSIHGPRRDSTPLLDLGDQPRAPTTRPFELQTTLVEDPADKENCAPGSGVAVTQATELSNASKRKRGSDSDDTEQDEGQLLHRAKKSKQEKGQGSKSRASATRSSPAAAPSPKTPTGDAIVRASNPTVDHGAGQSPAAPEVVEEREDRTTRTPPQRRRRQRKTYEKERKSRRLAGQVPEFGLLPERGEEPQPYEASSRRAATRSKKNGSDPHSGRVSKKPAVAKSTKSRAISEPPTAGASRPRRSKRN
ncbi:hypothetical protein F4803DRAFT_575418 [Xylaria telfairii]|nr:hypothetical protein F4803DRAFT_575418 [Xylaria telfairii]